MVMGSDFISIWSLTPLLIWYCSNCESVSDSILFSESDTICGIFALCAFLFQESDQRASGGEDMVAHQMRGFGRIALLRGDRDGAVFVPRAAFAVGQPELHTRVPVALMMQLTYDAHRELAVRGSVQRRVELPIERSPNADLAGV